MSFALRHLIIKSFFALRRINDLMTQSK